MKCLRSKKRKNALNITTSLSFDTYRSYLLAHASAAWLCVWCLCLGVTPPRAPREEAAEGERGGAVPGAVVPLAAAREERWG